MEKQKMPKHIAIIMDGNRRWAKKRNLPTKLGHKQGAETLKKLARYANKIGLGYLTVYAFSTENWNRSEEEVDALMKLLRRYLKNCIERSNKNNMRVRVIGEKSRLSEDIRNKIDELEECSKNNTGLNFTIALNYGSRDEIRRAVSEIATEVSEGKLSPDDISESLINEHLDTSGLPDPDLLIRTSGEERLSNFLLWQLAYTEFYFTDVLWPDFNKEELIKAVVKYNGRDRRFGKVK